MRTRIRSEALAAIATLAWATACTKNVTPVGGMLVTLDIDPSLSQDAPNRLTLTVGSVDGGAPYADASYAVDDATAPGITHFPTSFGIASNGDPSTAVAIQLGVWAAAQPLDLESYVVTNVPVTRVAELPVVFGSACDGSAVAPPAASCPLQTNGWCEWASDHWLCDASRLPDVGADAGSFAWEDAGVSDDAADEGNDAADAGTDAADEENADAPLDVPCDAPCGEGQVCVEGACVLGPPSCATGTPGAGANCGANGTDDCCASDEIRGGSFLRDYDGEKFMDAGFPASVSQFRLDRYEVTVGRFRTFVEAVAPGDASPRWMPDAGTGKHAHLNGGKGLSNGSSGGGNETGWDPSWDNYLPNAAADWNTALTRADCSQGYESAADDWTPAASQNEVRPINCVSWYEAYAFCIWDGGFLPSVAEWDYAAAGGDQQRVYAWGDGNPGANANYAIYDDFYPPMADLLHLFLGVANIAPVGSAAKGAGLWGQLDLTGNVNEYVLDYEGPYGVPCTDCAQTSSGTLRRFRGGGAFSAATDLYTSNDTATAPDAIYPDVGIRCARVPKP